MGLLVAGLLIFFGAHSVRIVAEDWRSRQIAKMGLGAWKRLYTIVSIIGFLLMLWGYGRARLFPEQLWTPGIWTHYLTAAITLPAFVLFVAAYVPGTRIKARVGHPFVAGTALWALAHLLSNGQLADLLLFGSFLVWAVFALQAARARDRRARVTYPAMGPRPDLVALAIGTVAWALVGFVLHGPLFGPATF